MMNDSAKEIRYFLYSQAFADGLKSTGAILLPALLGAYFGHFETGITIALGAMCVSLTDAPGPVLHKKNGMLWCILFAFLVAIITGYARANLYTMGLTIMAVTFLFSMFNVYGSRATAVGNAAILIMILTMDKPIVKHDIIPHAALILLGGFLYMGISLLLHSIQPYRHAQRALGDCIREIASYLSIRADFYNPDTDLEKDYRRLVAQQIVVNEKQDNVREIFFKTRRIVEETTEEGRRLVFTFVETVDLFEDITAAYYDYALLRKEFGGTGALEIIHASLKKIVYELDAIGIAVQTNTKFQPRFSYDQEIRNLKSAVDTLQLETGSKRIVLKKIIVNIRNLLSDIQNISTYFETDLKRKKTNVDHSHFVSHQSLDPAIIVNNFTLESSAFRHALRVTISCMLGFFIARWWGYGHFSYWILLTIAFILKPAYSLTKERNVQRIIGTFAGGAIGVIILLLVPNKSVQFAFMVAFMLGTYTFMRIRYLFMVICTTPYVLILFSLLGTSFTEVAKERILDTCIGCAIAFLSSNLLFPRWESSQLQTNMQSIVAANARYLKMLIRMLKGEAVSSLDYKLARRDVYLQSANLSSAFQRMLSEPKNKQQAEAGLHQFVVLNHILFSNIATVATTLLAREPKPYPESLLHLARKARIKLDESTARFGGSIAAAPAPVEINYKGELESADDRLMEEQLYFIYTVSYDIDKITASIAGQSASV